MREKYMTVGELRQIIDGLSDDARVIMTYECLFNDCPRVYVDEDNDLIISDD